MENEIYDNAELALAAYADLNKGQSTGSDDNLQALKNAGMTETQADEFAARWPTIEEQFTDPDTGLSVTVFRNGNEVNIAIRGTDDGFDVLADLVLGIGGIPEQYAALSVFYESLKSSGVIQSSDQVSVSGHSLGGFLTQVLAAEYQGDFEQIFTFNAPGIGGALLDLLPDYFGIPSNIDIADIINVRGDGFSAIANVGISLGIIEDIQIENSALSYEDHTIKKLTDSLAVFNLLQQLDSSINVGSYNNIFTVSSNVESSSLESVVNSIASLLQVGSFVATDNREALYARISAINTELYIAPNLDNPQLKSEYQNLQIVDINSLISTAQSDTTEGYAYRYALENLTPFAITGSSTLYASHNQNGELNAENFSEQYLTDRAAMLQWLIKYNESDTEYGDYLSADGFDGNVTYTDLSSEINDGQDLVLKIDGDGVAIPYEQIKFGTEYDDGIAGAANDDRLYGGGGQDSILGKDGDDYLEGGAGNDTLYGGDGEDYLDGGTGNDTMSGGDGADTLYGGEGDDRLEAGEEDIYGSGDINILQGGAGNDTLIGGDGIDLLYGGTGDDTLFVDRGGLYVSSWNQANYLGTEKMSGGEGFDTYYVGTSSNYATIEDSDGKGQIYAKASGIGDNTYKLKGGGFQLEQTTEQGLEADGYIQIHADGTVSNYTVAYELDGSQTLIAYGFNIPNFYNGMLGIKLEGGRVDTGNNIVDDVLDKIVFDEQFDPVDVERIKSAIKNAYEQSPIARKMLTDFAVIGDNAININFAENDFYTFVDGNNFYSSDSTAIGTNVTENAAAQQENSINIDLNWLTNNTYISTNGTAVEETLETALIHELTHLIKGFADTSNPGEKGETVTFANTIYREMGLAEQVSYLAYDPTGNTHVTNFEWW